MATRPAREFRAAAVLSRSERAFLQLLKIEARRSAD